MADYEVGNIFINISSSANKAYKEIDKITNSLKKLENVNLDKVTENLKSIGQIDFSPLAKSFESLKNIDSKSIGSFSKAINSLKSLSKSDIDLEKIKTNISQLTNEIEPFVSRIEKAEPSLKAFSNALDVGKVNAQLSVAEAHINAINSKAQSKKVLDDIKIEKANIALEKTKSRLDKVNNSSNKVSDSFRKLFNLGKLYAFFNYTKRASQAIVGMMTSAIDFNETLNKFQVSMGKYYERSIKFVNSLTYAFNLSTESVMNYQSTFKNMLDALGSLNSDVSYQLSETLTRMAIDYASLFNTSIDRSMQQFQSVLSGQIRSIRTTSGYDVSEASIFNIYKSIGGTKTMRQLDQLEKRLLRIIALQQQMEKTGAVGDFGKTINEPAQQLKQLSETFKEISRWVGQLTLVYMKPFIKNLLAGAIAVREILKSLNIARGYQYESFGKGGLFGEVENSAENAEKAVDSLKKSLLGFDELNILDSGTIDDTSSDYSLLIDQIKKYQNGFDKVNNSANKIAEKILTWLGYTKEVKKYTDENGNEISYISWELGKGETNMSKISDTLGNIGKVLSILGISKILGKVNLKLIGISTIIGVVVGKFAELYKSDEEFKKNVDKTFNDLKKAAEEFEKATKPIREFLGELTSKAIVDAIDKVGKLLKVLSDIATLDFENLKTDFLELTKVDPGKIASDVSSAIEKSFGVDWNKLWSEFYNSKIGKFFFQDIPDFFTETIPNFFTKKIPSFFETLWSKFSESGIGKFFFKTLPNFFTSTIPNFFTSTLPNLFDDVGTKLHNLGIDIVNGLISMAEGLVNMAIGALNSLINPIIKTYNKVAKFFGADEDKLLEVSPIPSANFGRLQKKTNSQNSLASSTYTEEDVKNAVNKILGNFGIQIPSVNSSNIVRKAVPMVGEYLGAKSNVEISTPENLIRQVVGESMLPIAQAIVNSDQRLIGAIEDLSNRPIELNGRKVSESIYDDLQRTAVRKGRLMFAK